VGLFMKPDAPVPEGYAAYGIPACTLAKAWVEGEEYEIFANAHALTLEALEREGCEADWRDFFQCEVYTDERFGNPKGRCEKVLTLDFYMPCRKK
jgi:AraC family transcriptional regulator